MMNRGGCSAIHHLSLITHHSAFIISLSAPLLPCAMRVCYIHGAIDARVSGAIGFLPSLNGD
jgi:hypothetical protein